MNKTDTATLWACLCAGDILLRREGDTLSLPIGDEPPVPLKPWNMVTEIKIAESVAEASAAVALAPPSAPEGATEPLTAANKRIVSPSGDERGADTHSVPSGVLKVVRLDRPVTDVSGLEMMPLRASFDVLDDNSYALAGKAAELIYWDQNTKYCGCCGAPMKMSTDISKRCTECGKEVWPQLATAVIVRITKEEGEALALAPEVAAQAPHSAPEGATEPVTAANKRIVSPSGDERGATSSRDERGATSPSILLVHAHNFRRPYYGLVAGFVETGESLEEAVRREVREETGLEIQDIRYFDSQPWPYPCGLMVGFTARYASGELHLQRSELSAGGWFTRDTMPPIPGRSSIARRLIDDWLYAIPSSEHTTPNEPPSPIHPATSTEELPITDLKNQYKQYLT